MVCEGAVLLRVQDLQKGAGRVPVIGHGQLVHLIENHDRVGDATLLDSVHDPSGHGTDIGPPVAPDIRLIPDAAQADTDVLSLQGFGDTLADTGLAGSGGSHKEQDRSGLLFLQIHDGNLLDDPLLDLFQAEMIFLKDLFRPVKVDGLGRLLFPGQACDKIQVVVEHAGFRTVLTFRLEPVEDFLRLFPCRLVHTGFLDLDLQLTEVRDIFRVHLIQLLLQKLHLLLDGRLPVDLLIIFLLGTLGL